MFIISTKFENEIRRVDLHEVRVPGGPLAKDLPGPDLYRAMAKLKVPNIKTSDGCRRWLLLWVFGISAMTKRPPSMADNRGAAKSEREFYRIGKNARRNVWNRHANERNKQNNFWSGKSKSMNKTDEWRSRWFNSYSWHLTQSRFREWDSSMADCLCNFKIKDIEDGKEIKETR